MAKPEPVWDFSGLSLAPEYPEGAPQIPDDASDEVRLRIIRDSLLAASIRGDRQALIATLPAAAAFFDIPEQRALAGWVLDLFDLALGRRLYVNLDELERCHPNDLIRIAHQLAYALHVGSPLTH